MKGFNVSTADFYCQALDVAMVYSTTGIQVGIKGSKGYVFLKTQEVEGKTKVTLYEGIGGTVLPAIAVRTPVQSLKPGDIIVKNGRAAGFFISAGEEGKGALANKHLRVITLEGHIKVLVLPESAIGIEPGVLAVVQNNAMNPMLLMALNSKSEGKDDGLMKMFMLQSMMGGNAFQGVENNNAGMQNLFPLMALLDSDGDSDFAKLMLLQQMMPKPSQGN